MNSMQFFTNDFGNRYLYEVNRNTFSRLGAETQFRRNLGEVLDRADSLHIIIGTDSGLLVRHVANMDLPEGSKYLFIELPRLLPLIQPELRDLSLGDQLILTTPDEWQQQLERVNFSDYAAIDSVLMYESLGAADAFLPDYGDLMSSMQQQLDALRWTYKQRLGHPLFATRQLENLVEAHIPAAQLKGLFAGRTAVVLGGGPSLDEMLPWLKERQEELLILAVSRVCRRLQQVGIKPHIVVTIDPSQMSFDISRELLTLDSDVILARANHAVFKLVAQWPGRSVYLDARYPWVQKGEPQNIGSVGPTVTNTALQLALAMGVSRIILGGVDLCHDRDGHTHASGSNEHEQGPRPPSLDIEVETNAGYTATTTPDFFNAIKAMGQQAGGAQDSGVEVINPAGGAARMRNVAYVPLEEVRYTPLETSPLALLHDRLKGDDSASRILNLSQMLDALAYANGRVRKIRELTEEALECNAKLFGRRGKPGNFKYKKRMDKIERQLDRQYKDLSVLVRMFSARDLLRMPPSDRDWTDEEIEQAGITYYTAYRNNAQQILDLIGSAQERLEAALVEEAQQPDFDRLLTQWKKDDIPGRALVWRHRHPDAAASLDREQASRLEVLEREFRTRLTETDTEHRRKLQREFNLGGVRARLLNLHKRGELEELRRLDRQLRHYDTPESAELQVLAQGYIAELRGEPQHAFECYAALIDLAQQNLSDDGSPSPRLEDALCRMASIALEQQQSDQALLVLQTLTEMSPVYAPQFAELLRLTGHRNEAAAIYGDYIKCAPDDLSAMLRLGQLYQESGSDEAARTAYEYVLRKDPDNNDASALLRQLGTAQAVR